MLVPEHMEITASLMAGYTFEDGSEIETSISGDYIIRDSEGNELINTLKWSTVDMAMKPGGFVWSDYGEILDDLASFLGADAEKYEPTAGAPGKPAIRYIFGPKIARWAYEHDDELSLLACYREDKRLAETS